MSKFNLEKSKIFLNCELGFPWALFPGITSSLGVHGCIESYISQSKMVR